VLLKWWQIEGNYSKYHGGKNHCGKPKEFYWNLLSDEIKAVGICVERTASLIGSKICHMEEQYRTANEYLAKYLAA